MSRYTPRPLTEEEIEDIISGIEKMTYVVKSATQMAQDEVKNVLRKQLSSIELVPQAIPEMKKIIRNQYNRAVVEPQTPVGFLVSEALSQPITQMTLNSVVGDTKIVIANRDTKQARVVDIGEWIDGLLDEKKNQIVKIPENRTEYLELETPVLIPSTTCDGRSEWMELTAVTRHLPVGDLVKIITRSGREVTATSQKSFLVYDEKEDKLKEKDGKDLKAGDYVGVHLNLENDDIIYIPNESLESYLFESLRQDHFMRIYHGGSEYPIRVLHTVDIEQDKNEYPYKKWRDIVLDPILSIERISNKVDSTSDQLRFVYDVTVPKSLNFNLFNGLVMRDTFHQSGSSKNMSSGIDALKELFNVSEERKNYNMNIHFNIRDLEYNQIFDLRTKLVQVKLEDVIKAYEYIPSSQPVPEWTDGYLKLTKQALPIYEWRLQLILDVNKMLSYKISMNKIIKMIRDKAPPNIVVVPSPMSLGILDLYPKEDEIDRQFGQNSSLMFLSVSVLPIIQQFLLSGISGIEGLFPTSIPVISIVSEEIPVSEDSNEYYLSLSRSQMRKTGIGVPELRKLFQYVNIKIIDDDNVEDGIYVQMPEKTRTKNGYLSPLKYVKDLLKKEEDKMNEEEKQMRIKQIKGYIAKPSLFFQASRCWIAETNGKNFLDVIKLPEVDPYYTYSNDFYETSSMLGIEATRTLLMMELKNVLVREEYINMRHISLLVDVMTNLGRLTPISFYGALRFGQSALSLATNQQSMKVFTGSSAFGKKEKVDSVSASVMLGKKAKIGSGYIDILSKDKQMLSKTEKKSITEEGDLSLQNEDIVEQQNIETNKSYMDVMFNTYESEIYGRKRKIENNNKIISENESHDSLKKDTSQKNHSTPTISQINTVTSSSNIEIKSKNEDTSIPNKVTQDTSEKLQVSSPLIPTLPKKTASRISGVTDITNRMKARKLQMTAVENVEKKIQIEDNLDVFKNL